MTTSPAHPKPVPKTAAPVFISEDRTVHTGQEALRRLAAKSDAASVDPRRGITRANRRRWEEAQRYEMRTWMKDFRSATDDRNQDHARGFDGYAALRGASFAHAIELGCGPFTNIRLIGRVASVQNIDLLDPLIHAYLDHPNTAYPDGRLRIDERTQIPATLHHTSIEDFAPRSRYDLVVMINVLEHCFDADEIFNRVLEMTAPGSVFVFHDRYYSAPDLAASLAAEYDAGHPLRIDQSVIDGFLSENFNSLYLRTVRFERHKWGGDRSYDGIYFIGRKA